VPIGTPFPTVKDVFIVSLVDCLLELLISQELDLSVTGLIKIPTFRCSFGLRSCWGCCTLYKARDTQPDPEQQDLMPSFVCLFVCFTVSGKQYSRFFSFPQFNTVCVCQICSLRGNALHWARNYPRSNFNEMNTPSTILYQLSVYCSNRFRPTIHNHCISFSAYSHWLHHPVTSPHSHPNGGLTTLWCGIPLHLIALKGVRNMQMHMQKGIPAFFWRKNSIERLTLQPIFARTYTALQLLSV
jgi:hypothetical protein